jgi:regulator of replication initiation timing
MSIKPNKNIECPKYDIVSEGYYDITKSEIKARNYFIFYLILFVLLFLFFAEICFSQEVKDSCISIQNGPAAKMVVELEQCRIKSQQLNNLITQTEELETQVSEYEESIKLYKEKEKLYKEIIDLQKIQITAAEEAMKDYREHIKFVQDSYKELIKDSKPNPFFEFFKNVLGIGAGVALGFGLGK